MTNITVHLVGAGPGDPDLLTVKSMRLLKQSDVVVYDRLVSAEILNLIPVGTKRIYVGKASGHHHFTQTDINLLLLKLARNNHKIVRLKGGDPYMFGRGGEEAQYLVRHGINVDVVPGITAASASAYAGIPLTHRGITNGVTLLTGHMREGKELGFDWHALVNTGTTLVLYMGLHNLPEITLELIKAGMPEDMPAALIQNCSLPEQRECITQLVHLAETARQENFSPPTLIVVGRVVELAKELKNIPELLTPQLESIAYV
ncbi:MAG: uroporphyrinogen-III C-methyltransferase [Sulfuriflexus sp.]|nr:uroporphyrinogen-III C-methyltransferase [Sulfuriflexus sp.]